MGKNQSGYIIPTFSRFPMVLGLSLSAGQVHLCMGRGPSCDPTHFSCSYNRMDIYMFASVCEDGIKKLHGTGVLFFICCEWQSQISTLFHNSNCSK